jgi:preprotein translocase subunit SecF
VLEILHNINVDWMRRRHLAYVFSGALVAASIVSLILHGGPRYGVDFTGGTMVEVSVTPPPHVDEVRSAVSAAGIPGAEIQQIERPGNFLVRFGPEVGGDRPAELVKAGLERALPQATVEIRGTGSVGPRVGEELRSNAIKAVFLALGLILVYVAIRYDWRYSVGAVVALFHDVFIAFGAVVATDREITLTVVAAFLTIAGFSINDTIVVFDRIRERRQALRKEAPEKVMNIAVNETLSRTIITSLTVALTTVALFVFGGNAIHDFSFAMLVGVVFGTYSSVYVASALALDTQLWLERQAKKQ